MSSHPTNQKATSCGQQQTMAVNGINSSWSRYFISGVVLIFFSKPEKRKELDQSK
jgi:hypothetical protein